MEQGIKIGVIISTYNNTEWLEKTLWGYLYQTRKCDEIIIADDGSGPDTARLIESYADRLPLKHVWHEDAGFRKTEILNRAIEASTADYLIFTDQDCVPRHDFVATHARYARKGRYLSGGYFKLPMTISKTVDMPLIASGECFSLKWLTDHGLRTNMKCLKLVKNECIRRFLNHITPARASWNGCNSSAWREDIIAANGFDQRMKYGGEDREFGERLVNAGIKGKQIRYSAILLHLDHSRPYRNEEAIRVNNAIRRETRRGHVTRTLYGIKSTTTQ